MTDAERLLTRVAQLEAENRALSERLASLEAASDSTDTRASAMSRRGLLRRAGSGAALLGIGVVGASLGALGTPGAVRANGEPVTVGGQLTDAITTTSIRNHTNDADVFLAASSAGGVGAHGYSASADGVYGDTLSGTGVHGVSHGDGVGFGVHGESDGNIAVLGSTRSGIAVQGTSTSGEGVEGSSASGSGVNGFSSTGAGVIGVSRRGRGGVFSGALAQAQLLASTASTHPKSGARGDLFVDKTGRLWFCKGGKAWKQLA